MSEHKRKHGHVLQLLKLPAVSSYHWTLTSFTNRVGCSTAAVSPLKSIYTQVLFVQTFSRSCGNGGRAKQQGEFTTGSCSIEAVHR